MSERFNHTRILGWATLTESERYHAGQLARMLDDSGVVTEWTYRSHTALLAWNAPDSVQLEAWVRESLLTALTHCEPKIAFRAMLQAKAYLAQKACLAQLDGRVVTSHYHDALTVAQNRIERFLGRVQDG